MRILLALVAACAVVVATRDYENVEGYTFAEYVEEFGKTYQNDEDRAIHELIFNRNLATIVAHNQDSTQTWKMGVNQFTDVSKDEMKKFFGYNSNMAAALKKNALPAQPNHFSLRDLPTSVDWRDKGIISPVKNQGGCGSCWAFGGVESIESAVAQAFPGKLPILAPQDVVSCAKNPHHCGGTGGCGGATAEIAFDYVAASGIALESAYPYVARDTACKTTVTKSVKVKGYVKLIENNYTDLITTLANVGPLAVNVDATPWSGYSSGVFTGCAFREIPINHVVQVVGYGTDSTRGKDYWIIRNSWGGSWGEKGYMRLERHSDGDKSKWCGPDHRPQDGTGCDGGPSVVTVCGSCGIWYDSSYPTGPTLL